MTYGRHNSPVVVSADTLSRLLEGADGHPFSVVSTIGNLSAAEALNHLNEEGNTPSANPTDRALDGSNSPAKVLEERIPDDISLGDAEKPATGRLTRLTGKVVKVMGHHTSAIALASNSNTTPTR